MKIQNEIMKKLTEAFTPSHIDVVNESDQHSVPPNSETHFKVLVVSQSFSGLSRVQRHQKVYAVLAKELSEGVHALSQQTFTEEEWSESLRIESPPCSSKQSL